MKRKTRWINVRITEQMIAAAKPSDCYECLIAIALREATGFVWHVWMRSARIETLCGPTPRRTWYMPDSVQALMRRFDRGDEVTPTTFRLPARFGDKKFLDYGAGVNQFC